MVRRATRRDRHRGRHTAGADAARFGPAIVAGAVFASARRRSRGAGAGRRSCGQRYRRLCRRLPQRPRRPPRRQDRHFRRQAGSAGDRIRLHPPGRGDCRRRARGRRASSKSRTPKPPRATSCEAISGTPATSCSAPACCSTNTARRCRQRAAHTRAAIAGAGTRSRLRHPRCGCVCAAPKRPRSTTR